MGRIWPILMLAGCRQLFGFEDPTNQPDAAPPVVECAGDAECSGPTPVCNLTSHTCEACDAHADCSSEVCDPSGACVDEATVVYVDGNGSGSECTKDAPCGTLNQGLAALTSGATKTIIKLTGNVVDDAIGDSNGRDFTVFAEPGATLASSVVGTILSVNSGSQVTIFDLEIVGGQVNSNGLQLSDTGSTLTLDRVLLRNHEGIAVVAGGSAARLTMRGCIVSLNENGGVDAQNVIVDITNTLVVKNGAPGATTGGLTLGAITGSTFAFNTIADNVSLSASTSGINCVLPFPAANNIVTNNGLDATCTFDFSLFSATVPPGTSNRAGDPMFANTNPVNLRAETYYRLGAGSEAIDNADPNATLATDIDGDPRPAGTRRDMGADERSAP